MKKRNYLLIAFLVLLISIAVPLVAFGAEFHGGWHGGFRGGDGWHGGFRGGIWIGPGWGWDPWWGWGYPYPYPYYYPNYYVEPPVAVPQQSPGYIQQAPRQEDDYYWYFCAKPQGYYPYVKQCPGGWMKVVPAPPADQQGR